MSEAGDCGVDDKRPLFVEPRSHHERAEICTSRAKYRDGRRPTAVKQVFTISDESRYLLVHRVPSLKLRDELTRVCRKFGPLEFVLLAEDYPVSEPFTEVFVVKYKYLQNAIYAKKRIDDFNFYGETLHVCYAPEMETVDETKQKLNERETFVKAKIQRFQNKAPKRAKLAK
ncbi:hypothetical protein B4U79_02099 [Dinothrombium tinctorium]|uniref:RNA-binding protein 48 n=1 Tax=Dinothrombium tinctorium TaxID=1965070 RepID=A0A3S3PEE7_9ACAR|nr:hypothetical protein B4U79_11782 [Dinothrombium tinctorium]RWS06720.1 hypothetical protein B4U79_02099 [Dinothrombium tinctorium]